MDAVFLSDMLDVRVLISLAKGEKFALGLHLDVQNSVSSDDTVRKSKFQCKALSPVTAQSSDDYPLFLVIKKNHLPSLLEG